MNFLNPLVLLGMAAAGIPVLLHLLNLRRLRTVDFSTVRFLQELQHTRVRRLRLQQILLLILRTLIIVFAVLAFARPTVPGALPLLAVEARSSVVILLDNSASMEAADQRGERFRQARRAAEQILAGLKDGDEVAVLPLAGRDPQRTVEFTRTFASAREAVERMGIADDRADLGDGLRAARALFADASHAHHEIYVVSDAQRGMVDDADTTRILDTDASVMLVRIGDGIKGLEQNLSVDSIAVLTRLVQPDRPVELEAFVRNGGAQDASNVLVTLAYDGTRVAQRAIDVPAGATRSVVVAAPPQRRGIIAASIELESDAIDRDNVRHAGIAIPPRSRVAVIGADAGARLARLALSVPGLEGALPQVAAFDRVSDVASTMSTFDVVMLVDPDVGDRDVPLLSQFVAQGGGLIVVGQSSAATTGLLRGFGLQIGDVQEAPADRPWTITSVVRTHPMFAGVFKGTTDATGIAESPRVLRQHDVRGGIDLMRTQRGPYVVEGSSSGGRVLFVAASPLAAWGTLGMSGVFPMLMVRSVLYAGMPRDAGLDVRIGERVQAPIPPRAAGKGTLTVIDAHGVSSTVAPSPHPAGDVVIIPAQYRAGVVKVMAADSSAVVAVSVHRPVHESILSYMDDAAWRATVSRQVRDADHVEVVDASDGMDRAITHARLGSELWPLCIVLALLCAIAEMLVARYGARETGNAVVA